MYIEPRHNDFSYSTRRYYVDLFYAKNIGCFPNGSCILDIGGKKVNKRGQFDIEKYNLKVEFANLDKATKPDYLCSANHIPVKDCRFEGVICSELIEHVPDPKAVLLEASRVLKPGGILLLCAPFMYRIHADPCDYGRYSDFFYSVILKELEFNIITIEKQGLFFSVLADMLKTFAYELQKEDDSKNKLKKKIFSKFVTWFSEKAEEWDNLEYCRQHNVLNKFTTGFGITARKL